MEERVFIEVYCSSKLNSNGDFTQGVEIPVAWKHRPPNNADGQVSLVPSVAIEYAWTLTH